MSEEGEIKTFVVVDLETNGQPSEQFNTCDITEISLYAFSAKQVLSGSDQQPPELPRVLHKLTLMIKPERDINPIAKKVTGLSNEMLENESPFDIGTAECLSLFLQRLEQPICMVAHNDWSFDYPIIRYVYEKLNKSLPSSVFCVDFLKAFREIDEKYDKIQKTKDEKQAAGNETNDDDNSANSVTEDDDNFTSITKYPPKGDYQLGNIYKRRFKTDAVNLHRAESDVEILSKLILHYGVDFLAYAEERKQLFKNVPKLGSSN